MGSSAQAVDDVSIAPRRGKYHPTSPDEIPHAFAMTGLRFVVWARFICPRSHLTPQTGICMAIYLRDLGGQRRFSPCPRTIINPWADKTCPPPVSPRRGKYHPTSPDEIPHTFGMTGLRSGWAGYICPRSHLTPQTGTCMAIYLGGAGVATSRGIGASINTLPLSSSTVPGRMPPLSRRNRSFSASKRAVIAALSASSRVISAVTLA